MNAVRLTLDDLYYLIINFENDLSRDEYEAKEQIEDYLKANDYEH